MNFNVSDSSASSSSSSSDDDNGMMINALRQRAEIICQTITNNNMIIQHLLEQQNEQVFHSGSIPRHIVINRDRDKPVDPRLEFAQFAAGCFWGVELAFQRINGVVKTEVGYSQGHVADPTYKLVCTGSTGHAEVIRVQFDPSVCPYSNLLSLFWSRHNPTTLNRQGNDVGTQYRSGIYYYNDEQARLARESKEAKQKEFKNDIVTEILPAKKFYRAEEYHQQYLEKGGGQGRKQSASKGCNDPIRCYG